jgi:hypothetical protein
MAGTTTSFPGMPGPAGPAGAQGPQGPQGANGPQGPQGIQGETGPAGAQGPQGPQGAQGDPGATGATGAQGIQGSQGVQGPQGDPGAAGADGDRYQTTSSTTLTINNATKTLTVEASLDYSVTQSVTIAYDITHHMHGEVVSYDDVTGVLVVDVTSHSGSGTFSAWVVNLSGAVGAVGPAGPEGPQGPQGVQGEQGVQGIQGVQGNTGPQGDVGPAGAQGVQGDTGPAGPQGPEGPQGPAGAAGTTLVTGLTDRYEELPAQTFSEFAHGSLVAASPTRDIQTAIDATPVGPACQVIVGPGSYAGATVTIPTGRNNIAIIGPQAGDFGGTVASLSSGRALTIGNNAVRVRLVNLQVEGVTTISTTGAGVHRIERCQLLGGLTIGAISETIYVVGCEVGNVVVPAGFTGVVLFDRCLFLGTLTNNSGSALRVAISDSAGGFAAPTTSATLNGRWQFGTSTTFYAGGAALLGAALTSVNGLTPAADRLAYYTGASSAALTTLTAFGRSLIDDVDATAARTTLGLGTAATSAATAFQSSDATLTALAGLTTAADRLAYFTGVDTAALATLTSYARTLLDDADAATARTTLGLTTGTSAGNVVVLDGAAKLPAVDGSALTGVVASPYTADAWTFQWSAAAGSPATLANYTGSANISAVTIVGAGAFGASAVTYQGVSCWEFTPTAVSERQELNILPVTPADAWELRVRVWLPGEDGTGTPPHVGALGKQVATTIPQFLAGASVTGACRQNGTAEEVKIETADIRLSWVTLTIRATPVFSGTTLTSRAQIAYQLWCGEHLVGTWNGSNVTAGSLAAGIIRFGKGTGTGTEVMRIASLQWRSGNNQATPAYTFRGMGFGGGGAA